VPLKITVIIVSGFRGRESSRGLGFYEKS